MIFIIVPFDKSVAKTVKIRRHGIPDMTLPYGESADHGEMLCA